MPHSYKVTLTCLDSTAEFGGMLDDLTAYKAVYSVNMIPKGTSGYAVELVVEARTALEAGRLALMLLSKYISDRVRDACLVDIQLSIS